MTSEDTKDTQTIDDTEATETPNADHDSAYRQLFSHPVMLEDLVRHFVDASLADALDFERMAQWQADLRAPPLERRHADMIWRVPMRQEDREVMIVLHLEFQSSSEPLMIRRHEGLCSYSPLAVHPPSSDSHSRPSRARVSSRTITRRGLRRGEPERLRSAQRNPRSRGSRGQIT